MLFVTAWALVSLVLCVMLALVMESRFHPQG
jgi:hypothetical protein